MRHITTSYLIPTALVLASLQACGITTSRPTQFYSFKPAIEHAVNNNHNSAISVGVGPIKLPKLIDRAQIVSRRDQHFIDRAEFHQWAGSLKEEISQIFASNLSLALNSNQIYTYPWDQKSKPRFQFKIRVIRFDGSFNKDISLRFNWVLFDNKDKSSISAGRYEDSIQSGGNSYTTYVATLNKLLDKASQFLADKVISASN